MIFQEKLVQNCPRRGLQVPHHVHHPHLLPLGGLDGLAQAVVGIFWKFFLQLVVQFTGIA